MISYWKLDEFGGVNTFIDSYGGHNGLCVDSTRPAENTGLVNQARNFNNNIEIYVADIKIIIGIFILILQLNYG